MVRSIGHKTSALPSLPFLSFWFHSSPLLPLWHIFRCELFWAWELESAFSSLSLSYSHPPPPFFVFLALFLRFLSLSLSCAAGRAHRKTRVRERCLRFLVTHCYTHSLTHSHSPSAFVCICFDDAWESRVFVCVCLSMHCNVSACLCGLSRVKDGADGAHGEVNSLSLYKATQWLWLIPVLLIQCLPTPLTSLRSTSVHVNFVVDLVTQSIFLCSVCHCLP